MISGGWRIPHLPRGRFRLGFASFPRPDPATRESDSGFRNRGQLLLHQPLSSGGGSSETWPTAADPAPILPRLPALAKGPEPRTRSPEDSSPARRCQERSGAAPSPPELSPGALGGLRAAPSPPGWGPTACNHADEVWPGLYLGDQDIASNRRELLQLRITHVLNASHCRWRGGADYYEGTGIRYLGIEAHDSPSFDMSPYFYPAADFIHQALNEGRILVHCAVGVSRSATLVLAYLMIRHHMPLVEAIKTVKDHRGIIPNRGFLRQLVALDNALRLKRSS
ncbi:PREDICTED: dual specificity protein phosphatase 26 [Ficedula albicollis]|uniref:dual specificity protein phosphatase 26 n=1 Tax=Ficedula albicollis TaxID=59894 RepID=UPI0007AD94A0|nr:PREDICTED: dual specificity protein phosphatase 26 [Ficedula albicollis]